METSVTQPRSKELLIRLFTMDGKPFLLQYKKLGYSRQQWLADRITLGRMIKDGEVKITDETRKNITYLYTPNTDGNLSN